MAWDVVINSNTLALKSEKQSFWLNVPWQMDLSSKAKIAHPLVLAVCMKNPKAIERIAQIRTF